MQNIYKNLILSEQNLVIAIEKRDYSRAALVSALLYNIRLRESGEAKNSNSCLEALDGLSGASIAGAFFAHPVVEEIGDRFSKALRPSDGLTSQWFVDGSTKYRVAISQCEDEISAGKSKRLLPEKLPSVN